MKKEKNIIVYVMNLPAGTVEAVREYEKTLGHQLQIMLLRDSRVPDKKGLSSTPGLDILISCDFSKPEKIAEALLPYEDELLAITCRSEQSMARFADVLPHVPYLRTPTTESLRWASDKYEMRKRFKVYDPKITPKFTLVKKNSKPERDRVIKKIGFPMIIKPTNMAASLFVTICYHEEELDYALRTIFRKIKRAYENDNRLEEPKVIAEEYMDGDLYSIDSYVDSRGKVYHCPLVRQITAKKNGHDDFYNYLQMTPSGLKSETVAKAELAAEKATHALGLRSSIVHSELMKVDDEWKIVEVAARMGGYRHLLHKLSCDINHALNDVLIRIPKKPIIPKKCKGYACAMKWFAAKEGKITELKGIKKIEALESFHKIDVKKKVGDRAVFARNGGRSVFDLFLYNDDRSKLLADIRRAEKLVEVKVAARTGGKKKVV
ncbi:ATP-grasp domain-containing protein [Candidatus Kaiserbacteria bacterium]|nr:ATP-grasp domain-containing protein [Candidatus Kaiserbacteria bacterium]USN88578.1 MAG: ATP-grasp domain-containing protein [Candidatus Nomurabacteria bacterium]